MPLIYTNVFYRVIFIVLFLLWCCSELVGPARWQGSKEAKRRDHGSTIVLAVSNGLGVFGFFVLPAYIKTALPVASLVFLFGTVVIVLGTTLRWWAIICLGSRFTGSVVVETSQQLVQSGPYTLIRHPSYTGILLVVIGFGLMMGNWASLLSITAGMGIGLFYRILVEEAALKQHFGEPYLAYMGQTKRLVPFLL